MNITFKQFQKLMADDKLASNRTYKLSCPIVSDLHFIHHGKLHRPKCKLKLTSEDRVIVWGAGYFDYTAQDRLWVGGSNHAIDDMEFGPNARFEENLYLLKVRLPLLNHAVEGNLEVDECEIGKIGPVTHVKGNIMMDRVKIGYMAASCEGAFLVRPQGEAKKSEQVLNIAPFCRFRGGVTPGEVGRVFMLRGITKPYQEWLMALEQALTNCNIRMLENLLGRIPNLEEKYLIGLGDTRSSDKSKPLKWLHEQSRGQDLFEKLLPCLAPITPTPKEIEDLIPAIMLAPMVRHKVLLNNDAYHHDYNVGVNVSTKTPLAEAARWVENLAEPHMTEVIRELPTNLDELWPNSSYYLDEEILDQRPWPAHKYSAMILSRAHEAVSNVAKIHDMPGLCRYLAREGRMDELIRVSPPAKIYKSVLPLARKTKYAAEWLKAMDFKLLEDVYPTLRLREKVIREVLAVRKDLTTIIHGMGYLYSKTLSDQAQVREAILAAISRSVPASTVLRGLNFLHMNSFAPNDQLLAIALPLKPSLAKEKLLQKLTKTGRFKAEETTEAMSYELDLV